MTSALRTNLMHLVTLACFAVLSVTRVVWAADPEPSISISTPTPKVYVGDQVIIDVEATAIEDDIEFDSLFTSLTFQRQTYGTRIAVVSGKVVETRIWRFETTAGAVGSLTLGSLQAGGVTSNNIAVSVETAPEIRWSPSAQDIALTVEWSKTRAYVQEQLLLTVRIRHLYPITRLALTEPELAGFRVVELVKDRRTEDNSTDGRSFTFLKRYALFAQSSGDINIPAFQATGQIIKSRLERASFALEAPATQLSIQPAPAIDHTEWWLPALDVTATDEWERDQRWLAAGEQVGRAIIIEASGVASEQLPDITMPDIRGLRITFVDSERTTEIFDNGIHARAVFNFNIRALSPVPVLFDPIRVHWWNTRDDQAAVATIKPGRIDIGAPDREALLESVAEHRRLTDVIIEWRRPLWLIAGALMLFALLLHHRALGTRLRHVILTSREWIAGRLADRRLKIASRQDDRTFLTGLEQWQATRPATTQRDNPLLERYRARIYAENHTGTTGETIHAPQVASALIADRRQSTTEVSHS